MNLNLYFILLLSHGFGAELLRFLFKLSNNDTVQTWRWRYIIFGLLFLLPYLIRGEFGYVISPQILIVVAALCILLIGLLIERHRYWLFTACALIIDTVASVFLLSYLGLIGVLLFGLSIQCVVCFIARRTNP
ncbi:hypothetical protein [Undibacterium flavidum]|uniref:MerC mercury resistance protein n=1 Tax=Undibacterium flavidum TaxID=2762297 RepID=A0ABR6YBX8_9BURK|nr:hypothetical protein [Undibacterium flavidum]MBC3873744.1 hypothetical protein [Undibacterium flavidum]